MDASAKTSGKKDISFPSKSAAHSPFAASFRTTVQDEINN
jgi:hypothetical protein